jgi:hypothetical protein
LAQPEFSRYQSPFQQADSIEAEAVYMRNKAWRRVMANDGAESQCSAARKVARHGDFAYWNGLLLQSSATMKNAGICLPAFLHIE